MGGVSDELKYLWIAFGLLFIIGSLTFIVSSVTDYNAQTYTGYLSPFVSFVNEGYNFDITVPVPILPDFNINFLFNPFSILGSSIQQFLVSQTIALALLPLWLGIPIIIFIISGFLYFIIKIIQGFIP